MPHVQYIKLMVMLYFQNKLAQFSPDYCVHGAVLLWRGGCHDYVLHSEGHEVQKSPNGVPEMKGANILREKSLVSIIVPVYKVEPYLRECLDSIICQTYTNLEIILVDDGSPDRCGEICEDYARKDSRITVYHKENGGLSDARNYGIDRCNGEYITFIDSDDVVKPNFAERLMGLISEYGADVASSPFVSFRNSVDFGGGGISGCVSSQEALRELLYSNRTFYTSACFKIYRTELFKNIRFPKGLYYEDAATIYRIFLRAERIAFTDEALYGYRINMDSIMHSRYSPKMLSCITVSRQIYSDISAQYPALSQSAASIAFALNRVVYFYMPFSRKEERRKVWAELIKYRQEVLTDHNARKRERLVAMASYSGQFMFSLLSGLFRLYHSIR